MNFEFENRFREMPLGRLLASLFFLGVVIPTLGLGSTMGIIEVTTQARIKRVQTIIQETDDSINAGTVVKRWNDAFPCVEREYYEDGILLARDTFTVKAGNQYELIMREYYIDNRVAAQETYGSVEGIEGIGKRREYYNSDGVVFIQECFNEAGIGLPKKCLTIGSGYQIRRNLMRSSFPPSTMFYIIFYR